MALLASDFDKSKYLRAEDIKEDRKFRIKSVSERTFERDGERERKLVLSFTNDPRSLVRNKSNIRTLRGAFNDDTAEWVGKIIVLFRTTTDFRGKMTPALRVRIPTPKQAAEAAGNGAAAVPPPSSDLGNEVF